MTDKTKARLEAYTDWVVVVCATVLTALDKFPPEWTVGLFVVVAGIAGVLKGKGSPGSAVLLVMGPVAKLIASLKGGMG